MNAVMTYEKEAIFILEHWDYDRKIYDHEGWCGFIAWNVNKERALATYCGDELVGIVFFWQLDEPGVDWSVGFPEERSCGEYLYVPLAVIKPEYRGWKTRKKMTKDIVALVDSPHLKYLSYNKLHRDNRLVTLKLEDIINGIR